MKIIRKIHNDATGAAHLGVAAVVVIVAAVGFVGGSIYNAQKRANDAARSVTGQEGKQVDKLTNNNKQAETTESKAPSPTPEEKAPAPAPAPKPAPTPAPKTEKTQPSITKFTITSTRAEVGSEQVALIAELGEARTGTCDALVKWTDGSNAKYYSAKVNGGSTCSISVPKSALEGNSTWKFYVTFYNDSKTVKGSSSGNTFTL